MTPEDLQRISDSPEFTLRFKSGASNKRGLALSEDGLTVQEELFIACYVAHSKDDNPEYAAYTEVFGRKSTRERTEREARRLMSTNRIRARLADLVSTRLADACSGFEDHLERMAAIRDKAIDALDFKAAVAAERAIGLASGHYSKSRLEGLHDRGQSIKDLQKKTDEELEAEISKRLSSMGGKVVPIRKG